MTYQMAIGSAADVIERDLGSALTCRAVARANLEGNRYRDAYGLLPLPENPQGPLNMFTLSQENDGVVKEVRATPDGPKIFCYLAGKLIENDSGT